MSVIVEMSVSTVVVTVLLVVFILVNLLLLRSASALGRFSFGCFTLLIGVLALGYEVPFDPWIQFMTCVFGLMGMIAGVLLKT